MVEKKINDQLRADWQLENKVIKLLLLGAAECGKTTVLNQMRILHAAGFQESELLMRRTVIYSNIVQAMAVLVQNCKKLELMPPNWYLEADASLIIRVVEQGNDGEPFSEQILTALKILWNDTHIQQTYHQRNLFQLSDSTEYFFNNLARIGEADYRPNVQDVLRIRIRTTGIVTVPFNVKRVKFRVFDVGGQRSERRKWIHCFDNVNALIFVMAISEFDQLLMEDNKTNRLLESISLYRYIINAHWFIEASMIQFLNKIDIFEQKLKQGASIKKLFPDFRGWLNTEHGPGPDTVPDSVEYLESLLANQRKSLDRNKRIYCHVTCATDTSQVGFVIDSILDTLLMINQENTGIA